MDRIAALPALLGLLMACGGTAVPAGAVGSRGTALEDGGLERQGMRLQGMRLQGMRLQGMRLQGMRLQGMRLQGMRLQGGALAADLVLEDGQLRTLTGADVVGATLVGDTADGGTVELRIDAAAADPEDGSGETWLYTLSYATADGRALACEADADGAAMAIPLAGLWDESGARQESSTHFTFACTSGVLAKCTRWGYRPWRSVGNQSLVPYHQACTRMARADYCGDGQPHTREGTLIDVYDPLGIQTQVPNDGMVFEAAWTEDGAYCVSKQRWNILAATLLLECPQRLQPPLLSDALQEDSCAVRLSPASRDAVRVSNRSYLLQVAVDVSLSL